MSNNFHLDEQNLFVWTVAAVLELNSVWGSIMDEKKLIKGKKIIELVIGSLYSHFAKKRWAKENIKRWNNTFNKDILGKNMLSNS